jgi:hypothetical protein
MGIRPEDVTPYVDPNRWASLARLKRAAWLSRWERGPAAQIAAIDDLRAFARSTGARAPVQDRQRDLNHHIRVASLMRRADGRRD